MIGHQLVLIRREIWEHRSIWLTPTVIAAVICLITLTGESTQRNPAADVAVLPRWMRVHQLLDFVESTHPNFSRQRADDLLGKTKIMRQSKVRQLSKGMVTQLHLAIIMAIDAKLLVLDEPTLGLDILFRKEFYSNLLSDYFDGERTILITTHQVEEIENLLTDIMFIDDGRILLDTTMDSLHDA